MLDKIGVLGVLIFSFLGCSNAPELVENFNAGEAFGTTYNITYITQKKVDYQAEFDSIFKVVNQSMSTYIPTSDISKINTGDSTVVVDHMFVAVLQLSKSINEATEGYFDPTVGTLVNAWGFGPGTKVAMDSTKVDSLLQYVGFDKVQLLGNGTIKKTHKDVKFDFNAIAKGYAIDRLALLLKNKGVTDFLVEVGGEIVANGTNSIKTKNWMVGIDDPETDDRTRPKKVISLKNTAMASSGNYRKFRIDKATGEKYVHTVNPKTGFTRNANTLAATVLADNCAKADGYATAFMAMDLAMAKVVLQLDHTIQAYIIYLDDNGDTQEFMTDGFKAVVKE